MEGIFTHSVFYFILLFLRFLSIDGVDKCLTDNDKVLLSWDWEVHGKDNMKYFINLCKQALNCPKKVSVCQKNDKIQNNYGDLVTDKKIPTIKLGKYGFSITYNNSGSGNTRCTGGGRTAQTQIIFHCDKNLGYPELLDDTDCLLTFEFNTNMACPKKTTKINEIPCVIYNPKDHIKRDLSPLIKHTGGHYVLTSQPGLDIWVNVCRDITGGSLNCVDGIAACRSDVKKEIGKISDETKLRYINNNIVLTYKGKTKISDCAMANTSITFVCSKDGYLGPVLISSSSTCSYEIEWRTDHACPNKDILTTNCTFSNEEVTFDLSKLEKPIKEESYGVKVGKYTYRIKVCSNGQPCGSWDTDGSHTAVCQVNPSKYDDQNSCGDANHRSVRYADGNVTLIYKHGKPCHNGLNRTTIINFVCDPSIDIGAPIFDQEEHCYYFFTWKTRFVCPSRPTGSCSAEKMIDKKRLAFDLSLLTKDKGSWIALNTNADTTGYTYYINVCGNVDTTYIGCNGASVCEVHNGKARKIGLYTSAPRVISKTSLSLNYSGQDCGSKQKISTVIKFVCAFKHLESPPELESRSWDGCNYVFTWATAAACDLDVRSGDDCVLNDMISGNRFDLRPLRDGPDGKKNYFTVKKPNSAQTFLIKVCGSLAKEQCGNKGGFGACQKTKDGTFGTGKGNSNLFYYDGKVNLTYSDGDKCNKNGHPARTTHITFFCNETAGVGAPVYDKENYCTYHFVWYTKYVCPPKIMECLAVDDKGQKYNLESLVKTDGSNWFYKHGDTKFYINVCRQLVLTNETQNCPAASSFCVNGTKNVGEISSGLQYSKNGGLTLQYKAGECQTIITFICQENEESGPEFSSSSGCIYSFTWRTEAACPIKAKKVEGCSNNGDTISIAALQKSGTNVYSIEATIDGKKQRIEFNICKNITCGSDKSSTVCLIDGKKKVSLGRSAGSTVERHDDSIVLTYRNGHYMEGKDWGRYATTVITFNCAQNSKDVGDIVFRGVHENVYTIEFATPIACPATAIKCSITSKNMKYNLSPLSLETGNWMAADVRDDLDYYINICKPYNPQGINSCSGQIGGCQVDTRQHKVYNMGFLKINPFVSGSGDLTIQYLGGDACHKEKFSRSTRINLFCSKIHGSPVFINETEQCEYVFNWRTPSACPLISEKATGNCRVYDSTNGVLYDLTSLKSLSNKVTLNKDWQYYVTFCNSSQERCLKEDVKACIQDVNENDPISTFKDVADLVYYDDSLRITMTGSSNYKIINIFTCGDNTLSQSKVIRRNENEYEVYWTTNLACRPVRGSECSLTDSKTGIFYDVSVLAQEARDWQARVNIDKYYHSNKAFYLSVCKPLVKIGNIDNIGWRAAVKDSNSVTSLGSMSKELSIVDGYLTMVYGRKDPKSCGKGETKIQFVCDTIPEERGREPVLDFFDETNCIAHFTWITKAACPVHAPMVGNNRQPCTAIHPATMKTIDLMSLHKDGGYDLKDSEGNEYKLNLCRNDTSKFPYGMCRKSNDQCISVGDFNADLSYRQGFLYLVYKNGHPCPGTSRNMETLISFVCLRNKSENAQPYLERTSECTHYVTWKTQLACETQTQCFVKKDNDVYDLSRLVRNDGNYQVFYQDKLYIINVCRPLVNEQRCPSGSSVCRLDFDEKGVASQGINMGQESVTSTISTNLIYKNGQTCSGSNYQTTIQFVCDKSQDDIGYREVVPDGCSLTVQWLTSLVCAPKPYDVYRSDNCTLYDPHDSYCFDFTKLPKSVDLKIPNGNIHFSRCGESLKAPTACDGSEVCLVRDGKVTAIKKERQIKYNKKEVVVVYDDGGDVTITIIYYCGEDKANKPRYLGQVTDSANTQYTFNWITPLVCPARQPSCILENNGKIYDFKVLRRNKNPWNIMHGKDSYLINICGNIDYKKSSKCLSSAIAIKITNGDQSDVIGVDTTLKLYMKDGEYPIYMEYSGDLRGCPQGQAKVVHKFKCANGNYPPKVESADPDGCRYVFVWRTHAACAEKRTQMKEISPWVFSDYRSSFCELDLNFVRKNLIGSQPGFESCESGEPKLYYEGEYFELEVDCLKGKKVVVSMQCADGIGNLTNLDVSTNLLRREWRTSMVCDEVRKQSCAEKMASYGGKTAATIIGVFLAIALIAAIVFFIWKPEKRSSVALWLRWHVRKYVCCKTYEHYRSYKYTKVESGDGDEEDGCIIQTFGTETIFSDDEDEDNNDDKPDDDDDDELLPWDDDLLTLDD